MKEYIYAMAAALVLDRLLGDPDWVPHPVVGFGWLIRRLEGVLQPESLSPRGQLLSGVILLGLLLAAAVIPAALLMALTRGWLRWGLMTGIFWLALSMETMKREACLVQDRVSHGTLEQARRQVSRIVGRDPASLDRAGVIRAGIESVAESTSDGVVAPLVYGLLLGPAGAMAYKAVNTLDSMVGYRNQRYLWFGRASARADDLLNLIPARITGCLAALLAPLVGGSIREAFRIWRRDHRQHASPNSGHPEAAFAGALGISLAGPACYDGVREDKPWINPGAAEAQAGDITRSVRLMQAVVLVVMTAAIALDRLL